jgi:hypothetical protein
MNLNSVLGFSSLKGARSMRSTAAFLSSIEDDNKDYTKPWSLWTTPNVHQQGLKHVPPVNDLAAGVRTRQFPPPNAANAPAAAFRAANLSLTHRREHNWDRHRQTVHNRDGTN